MKKYIILLIVGIFLLSSCKNSKKVNSEPNQPLESKKVSIVLYSFDKLLFETPINTLQDTLLKYEQDYKYIIPQSVSDTGYFLVVKDFASDPDLKEVYSAIKKKYNNLSWLQSNLEEAIAKAKEYFPQIKTPKMYTLITADGKYNNRVVATDDFIAVSLDYYVAKNFQKFSYLGMSQYMLLNLDSINIFPDCMYTFGANLLSKQNNGKRLLDIMITQGKILYFLDKVIPNVPDELKIRYTQEQLKWCKENEGIVWSFFVQQQLLYEEDDVKIRNYVNEGPKTPNFPGSPARLADYIGWQIVKKYMEKKNVSLEDLFKNTNAQQILTESGYKPKRK